jgi:hypothetical protein
MYSKSCLILLNLTSHTNLQPLPTQKMRQHTRYGLDQYVLGHEADHAPLSSLKAKNGCSCSCTSTPSIFLQGVQTQVCLFLFHREHKVCLVKASMFTARIIRNTCGILQNSLVLQQLVNRGKWANLRHWPMMPHHQLLRNLSSRKLHLLRS